jgi:hypothetical protein
MNKRKEKFEHSMAPQTKSFDVRSEGIYLLNREVWEERKLRPGVWMFKGTSIHQSYRRKSTNKVIGQTLTSLMKRQNKPDQTSPHWQPMSTMIEVYLPRDKEKDFPPK